MNNIYKLNAKKLIVKDEEEEEEEKKSKSNNEHEYERDEEYVEIDREKYKDEIVFQDGNSNLDINNKNNKEDYVRSNLNRSSSIKYKRNSKITLLKSNSIENRSLNKEKTASQVKQNQSSSDYVFKVRLLTERKTYWSEPLSVQCVKMNNLNGNYFERFSAFLF